MRGLEPSWFETASGLPAMRGLWEVPPAMRGPWGLEPSWFETASGLLTMRVLWASGLLAMRGLWASGLLAMRGLWASGLPATRGLWEGPSRQNAPHSAGTAGIRVLRARDATPKRRRRSDSDIAPPNPMISAPIQISVTNGFQNSLTSMAPLPVGAAMLS